MRREIFKDLIVEATNALLEGDIDTGKSLIMDYLNATEAFSVLTDQLHKDETSIRRMLGTMDRHQAVEIWIATSDLRQIDEVEVYEIYEECTATASTQGVLVKRDTSINFLIIFLYSQQS